MKDKDVPDVTNKAGINRYVWDFHEDGPVQWKGAAREEYRGPKIGAVVVPGTYTVRIVLDGKTLTQTVTVKPDPRDNWTQARVPSRLRVQQEVLDRLRQDRRSTQQPRCDEEIALGRIAAAGSAKNAALRRASFRRRAQRDEVFALFTADYHNDEDSIQRPARCAKTFRRRIPRAGNQPPTPALLEFAARFDGEYQAAFAKYNAFVTNLAPLQAQLKSAGLKPLDGASPLSP